MIEEIKIGDKNVLFARHNGKLIYPKYASTENLVLHYDFSGRTNLDVQKGVAEDLSGNGNNGVLQNFAYTNKSGYLDNALIFDDIDDVITIPKPLIDLDNFTYSEGNEVLSFRGENVATVVDGVVEIGGRNLLLNTQSFTGNMWSRLWEIDGEYRGFTVRKRNLDWSGMRQQVPVENGEYYTFSSFIKIDESESKQLYSIIRNNGNNIGGGSIISSNLSDILGKERGVWYRAVVVVQATQDCNLSVEIEGYHDPDAYVYLAGYKFEKGTIPTDWTPAPEDLETTTFKPFFDKKIKSALYWNRALTDEELLQVYNTQIKRT